MRKVVGVNVVVRNVDEALFRKFKAWAVSENLNIGNALNLALRELLRKEAVPKKRASILDFKPVDCGPGSERTSMEIDKIVYGVELH